MLSLSEGESVAIQNNTLPNQGEEHDSVAIQNTTLPNIGEEHESVTIQNTTLLADHRLSPAGTAKPHAAYQFGKQRP